jgi:hypothetical protein
MNKYLYALLKEYDDKELDDEFIYRAFEIMMDDDKLLKLYIREMHVVSHDSKNLGTYSNEDHLITINKKNIVEKGDISNKKILALEVLRHEIEHARQLHKLCLGRDDIESKVLGYSLADFALDHGLRTFSYIDQPSPILLHAYKVMNYVIDPGERLAEIRAWKFLVNLLKNQRKTQDLLEARSMLYYSYVRGYKDNGIYLDAPTYQFIQALGLYHEFYLFKKRVDERKYCFDSRLTYGLPIKYDEHKVKTLRKVKLQRKKTDEKV